MNWLQYQIFLFPFTQFYKQLCISNKFKRMRTMRKHAVKIYAEFAFAENKHAVDIHA